jgi:hypothetical protein
MKIPIGIPLGGRRNSLNIIKMRINNNRVEVLLVSNQSTRDLSPEELVNWMKTTMQPAIEEQEELAQKIFPVSIKGLPAFYLS